MSLLGKENTLKKLTEEFYKRDTVTVAKELIGKYLCHVVNGEATPCAVLLRACQPISPLETLSQLRYGKSYQALSSYQKKNFANGPGKLTKAFAITKKQNKASLLQDNFFIFEKENEASPTIKATPRINIDYAEEYATKPWRFITF